MEELPGYANAIVPDVNNAAKAQQASGTGLAYMVMNTETGEPPVFTSTKQIQAEASQILSEWSTINTSAADTSVH